MDSSMTKKVLKTKFEYIGGYVCLDLTNTVGGVRGERSREDLTTYADLVSWSHQADLLTQSEAEVLLRKAERDEGEALAVLRRAHALREAIYQIFTALIADTQPLESDLDMLNRELREGTTGAGVILTMDGFAWKWIKEDDALDQMLGPLARSAATLLTSDERNLVRQCANQRCEWLFVDTTKNHRRQYCRTMVCGNTVRVRRHRQQQRNENTSDQVE